MNELSWGIIGCGDVTEVKSGPAFNKVPHSRLQAVMRRDAAKAADYAARHGVPQWYSDAADLLADPAVNAVYIATPPDSHEQYALQALAAGKPVYVEKPVATSSAAAARMAAAARTAGLPLVAAHYRRAQPLFRRVKELLDGGAIGRPLSVELVLEEPHDAGLVARTDAPWRLDPAVSGGGLFWDLAPHALDLVLHWFGSPGWSAGASWNAHGTYKAPDTTVGAARLPNNVLFQGRWCFGAPQKVDECRVRGTDGELRFSIFASAPLTWTQGSTETRFDFGPLPHVQEPMIAAVTAHFLGHAPNPAPMEEAVEVIRWMEAFSGE